MFETIVFIIILVVLFCAFNIIIEFLPEIILYILLNVYTDIQDLGILLIVGLFMIIRRWND